jgi:DNA-binding MarR family transcriptional regulator
MGSPAGFEGARQSHAPRGNRPEAMRIWLLGGLRVSVGSRSIEPDAWRLKKAAALVKLLALAPGHRMPMGELAQKSVLFSRRSGLGQSLRRLEAEGLVRREQPCPKERSRGSCAVLTEAGLDRLCEAHPTHLAGVREHFFEHFSEGELRAMAKCWRRVLSGA